MFYWSSRIISWWKIFWFGGQECGGSPWPILSVFLTEPWPDSPISPVASPAEAFTHGEECVSLIGAADAPSCPGHSPVSLRLKNTTFRREPHGMMACSSDPVVTTAESGLVVGPLNFSRCLAEASNSSNVFLRTSAFDLKPIGSDGLEPKLLRQLIVTKQRSSNRNAVKCLLRNEWIRSLPCHLQA